MVYWFLMYIRRQYETSHIMQSVIFKAWHSQPSAAGWWFLLLVVPFLLALRGFIVKWRSVVSGRAYKLRGKNKSTFLPTPTNTHPQTPFRTTQLLFSTIRSGLVNNFTAGLFFHIENTFFFKDIYIYILQTITKVIFHCFFAFFKTIPVAQRVFRLITGQ